MLEPTMFDAQAVREALTPPEYKDTRGRVRVGVLLSVEEFWRHLDWWRQWGTGEVKSPSAWVIGLRAFLTAVFPRTWRERLLLRRSVADEVLTLPFKRQQEAAAFFFGSLVNEHLHVEQLQLSEPGPTTNGTTTSDGVSDSAGPSGTLLPDSTNAIPAPIGT